MAKKIPSPNGRNGNPDHVDGILEILKTIFGKFFKIKTEGHIKTKEGKSRFADLVAYDENGNPIEIHQVGRINKNGTPVARERRAIEDIEKTTGLKVIFHALPFVAVFFIVLYFVAKFV